MRGSDDQNGSLFSYVNLEERIPVWHPLCKIVGVVNAALATLDADFDQLSAGEGRPSIAPERLLRASLIQIEFSIRSERRKHPARTTGCSPARDQPAGAAAAARAAFQFQGSSSVMCRAGWSKATGQVIRQSADRIGSRPHRARFLRVPLAVMRGATVFGLLAQYRRS